MKLNQLTTGIHKVRISDSGGIIEFNISVVSIFGVLGIAAFNDGEKIPRKCKHLISSNDVRNWIEKMKKI